MWIFLGVFAHVFPGRRSSLNASPLEIKVSWLQFEQNLCDLNPFPLSEALRRVGAHRIPGLYRRRKKKQQNPPQNRMKANMFLGRVCKSSTRGRWSTTAVLLKSPQHRFPSREEPKPQGQTPKWGELEAARGRGCGGRLRKDENQRVIAWLRLEGPSMALQETYGNWMGPPPVPAKRLVRQAGIYSVAGKMTPMDDFRPASPDSFDNEDDYDDVSVSGLDRGYKPPAPNEDLQSQRSRGGVYILAGKPPPSNPSPVGNPKPSCGRGRPSVVVLYILVVLSFVVWVPLLALAMVKQVEIMAELELLRSNYTESQIHMLQELSDSRQERTWLRSGMRSYYRELWDITARICKAGPKKKCLAGWKDFEESCYYFSTERMSWREAKEICDDRGAHLVIINSEQEQAFLKNSINSSKTYWLGVTDEQQEGTWLWTNGDAVSISYWMAWQENKDQDQKDCGAMVSNGMWADERCSHLHHWICERPWKC
ncbi:uncharacterized protein CLEC17A [Gallus gallus]|uniref:uncharacterized protein CLEC17A n=1 Tax=Gallus gallus TaxID=9031 RepID=UPI001AE7FB09|nr:uncharacterized protein CLEC17A [Gallus gallus]